MPNLSASDLAGQRIGQIRQRLGWTRQQLADRCAAIGAPYITAAVITDLETRRRSTRKITVDEWLILAKVLDVPPVFLITPLDASETLEVAPGVDLGPLDAAAWIGDDDTALTLGLSYWSEQRTERAISRMGNAAPLALLRQIRLTSRAIKNRARLIEHYRGEGREDEADTARHALVPDIALYLRLTDWLASLGYTPPQPTGMHEILHRYGTPATLAEADQQPYDGMAPVAPGAARRDEDGG